jgi:hypothetical protein
MATVVNEQKLEDIEDKKIGSTRRSIKAHSNEVNKE